ncbi:MAG: type IV toxin-antitoxin system AbiEi family antitoxin domain-containing protein [Prevotella sp.]|nr:type IV toxin-antitoxin system AbiEi family antitoxin domain-containing protein [Prevotella sp.]
MNSILQKIAFQGGILSVSELGGEAEYKQLLRAAKRGDVVRVRQGVYAEPSSLLNTMIDVERIIPRGIVCMYSAWSHYQLTTTIPPAFCIAISSKRKVAIPHSLPITLYYWKEDNLLFGISENDISGYHVRITDLERSVCDAIKYRNKIGLDLCAEIIRNYVKRKDKNLSRLNEYSKKLRISRVVSTYLEITME